jgi:hypothetical protein
MTRSRRKSGRKSSRRKVSANGIKGQQTHSSQTGTQVITAQSVPLSLFGFVVQGTGVPDLDLATLSTQLNTIPIKYYSRASAQSQSNFPSFADLLQSECSALLSVIECNFLPL